MCWNVSYVLLIVLSTIVDYISGIVIYNTNKAGKKRLFLIFSLITNLGLLFFFKYYGFLTSSAESLLEDFNIVYHFPVLNVLLPVGISFYTFQTLSYTIDIYRGITRPEKHIGKFALYVSFFPQLVAGPIERSYNLLPQLRKLTQLNYAEVRNGLVLMMFGFFKKVVIADRLAEYVNLVYNNPSNHGGLSSIIATYFFAFQIYCDFSGYTDIAIGAALVMGIQLMKNFRQPYFSKNISEFWGRWHISLSTWFRDYLYIPLGGNRVAKSRWYFNLMFVFIVSGLWHGADWNFAIWGMLHGCYLIGTILFNNFLLNNESINIPRINSRIIKVFQMILTFHLVLIGWVFFRANKINDAFLILRNSFDKSFWGNKINLFEFPIDFQLSIILIGVLLIIEYFQAYKNLNEKVIRSHWSLKWALLTVGIISILVLGKFEGADFLYFQF